VRRTVTDLLSSGAKATRPNGAKGVEAKKKETAASNEERQQHSHSWHASGEWSRTRCEVESLVSSVEVRVQAREAGQVDERMGSGSWFKGESQVSSVEDDVSARAGRGW
jgi:hypothetical protein